jgi:hypothetical protein
MNDSKSSDAPSDFGSDTKELRAQQNVLRKLLIAMLVAMLITSGSLAVFLIPQVIFVGKDLETTRPQVNKLVADYQQFEEPQIKNFIGALVNFSRQHPDFTPILAKYKIAPEAQVAPTGVPTAPAGKK